MPIAEKGVRGKGLQPWSPPQHRETRSATALRIGYPRVSNATWLTGRQIEVSTDCRAARPMTRRET